MTIELPPKRILVETRQFVVEYVCGDVVENLRLALEECKKQNLEESVKEVVESALKCLEENEEEE